MNEIEIDKREQEIILQAINTDKKNSYAILGNNRAKNLKKHLATMKIPKEFYKEINYLIKRYMEGEKHVKQLLKRFKENEVMKQTNKL